jgi:hypothetical protein
METLQTTAKAFTYMQAQIKEQMKGESDKRMRREEKKIKGTTQ